MLGMEVLVCYILSNVHVYSKRKDRAWCVPGSELETRLDSRHCLRMHFVHGLRAVDLQTIQIELRSDFWTYLDNLTLLLVVIDDR